MTELQFISLAKLKECPLNPRRHYRAAKIAELAEPTCAKCGGTEAKV